VSLGPAKRVCILGAESTGKTTLAKALAERFATVWVPEYGAVYHHRARGNPHTPWSDDEFVHIAVIQNWLEDFLAQFADPFLVCDTDAFTTSVFAELYLGHPVPAVAELARVYDLYVLCDAATPFERDALGLRRREAREDMDRRYRERIRAVGAPFVDVRGTTEERVALVSAALDGLE
jgi:HTH-type transcriptional regulator, transcriptional repressor of NAD biosynthesis genes